MALVHRLWLPFVILAALAVNSACSGTGATTRTNSTDLSVVAIGRDLSVDTSRLSLALLIQQEGEPVRIENAADRVDFSYGVLNSSDFIEATGVVWRPWPLKGGAYVFDPAFDSPGTWEIRAKFDQDGTTYSGSAYVTVAERSSSVAVGSPAPRSETKTGSTAEELRQITSAANPDPALYSMTVAAAVQSGRPTVIAFSTPAFCQTATCGPQLDVISDLRSQFGDRVNFVHVEVWDNVRDMLDSGDANIGRVAPAVDEWGLITEPWTFLVDAKGVVFDKFEAFTNEDELASAIELMLAG